MPIVLGLAAPKTPGSVDKRVAALNDACTRTASGGFANSSGDPLYWTDTSQHRHVLRFTGVAIPKGATITSAKVTVYNHQVQASPTVDDYVTIGLEQVDNATQVSSASDILSRFSSVGSTVNWQYSTTARDAANVSPDLSSLLQSIVNRPGWSSGNAVQFLSIGSPTGKNASQMRSYGTGAAGTYPRLEVTFLA